MKKLFEFLWSGCWHEWKIEAIAQVFDSVEIKIPIGKKYTLRCKKCGEMKIFKSY